MNHSLKMNHSFGKGNYYDWESFWNKIWKEGNFIFEATYYEPHIIECFECKFVYLRKSLFKIKMSNHV